jgi:hypothetical protein
MKETTKKFIEELRRVGEMKLETDRDELLFENNLRGLRAALNDVMGEYPVNYVTVIDIMDAGYSRESIDEKVYMPSFADKMADAICDGGDYSTALEAAADYYDLKGEDDEEEEED